MMNNEAFPFILFPLFCVIVSARACGGRWRGNITGNVNMWRDRPKVSAAGKMDELDGGRRTSRLHLDTQARARKNLPPLPPSPPMNKLRVRRLDSLLPGNPSLISFPHSSFLSLSIHQRRGRRFLRHFLCRPLPAVAPQQKDERRTFCR